jgi:hypothetical protein
MEGSPSEAKTELEGWAAHFVRGYLPDLAEHKDRIAEVVVDRLWRVLIREWYQDLLSERAWHHAVLRRLKSDWPKRHPGSPSRSASRVRVQQGSRSGVMKPVG